MSPAFNLIPPERLRVDPSRVQGFGVDTGDGAGRPASHGGMLRAGREGFVAIQKIETKPRKPLPRVPLRLPTHW